MRPTTAPTARPAGAWTYSSVFGFWTERRGGLWLVFSPAGAVVARSRVWYRAITFLLAQRPGA